MEKALTLKEVAELLSVSYNTVYSRKEELGFFQVGSVWRVWPDVLQQKLAEPRKTERRVSVEIQDSGPVIDAVALLDEQRDAAKKFQARIAEREARKAAGGRRRKR